MLAKDFDLKIQPAIDEATAKFIELLELDHIDVVEDLDEGIDGYQRIYSEEYRDDIGMIDDDWIADFWEWVHAHCVEYFIGRMTTGEIDVPHSTVAGAEIFVTRDGPIIKVYASVLTELRD